MDPKGQNFLHEMTTIMEYIIKHWNP